MGTEIVALGLVQLVPLRRAVDGAELLADLHHVRRIDRNAPVDPLRGVPLLVLAALVQIQQPGPAVVVLPVEPDGAGRRNVPRTWLDRHGVVVVGAHGSLPECGGTSDITREYRLALVAAVPAMVGSEHGLRHPRRPGQLPDRA